MTQAAAMDPVPAGVPSAAEAYPGEQLLAKVGQLTRMLHDSLRELGYDKVFNLGAFKDWAESGGPVDK